MSIQMDCLIQFREVCVCVCVCVCMLDMPLNFTHAAVLFVETLPTFLVNAEWVFIGSEVVSILNRCTHTGARLAPAMLKSSRFFTESHSNQEGN